MLQNAYFLAKIEIGADTAENEQHFAEILPKTGNYPTGPGSATSRSLRRCSGAARARCAAPPRGTSSPARTSPRNYAAEHFAILGRSARIAAMDAANFTGLVLGCIETKFCKKICVGKLSTRSTQCTLLHSSAISIFCKKLPNISLN